MRHPELVSGALVAEVVETDKYFQLQDDIDINLRPRRFKFRSFNNKNLSNPELLFFP
ncbi:MAG: hypothetical protein KH301_05930 [Brachyspira sp.]|nr:hypothetical protein [Brachyspira sp.]